MISIGSSNGSRFSLYGAAEPVFPHQKTNSVNGEQHDFPPIPGGVKQPDALKKNENGPDGISQKSDLQKNSKEQQKEREVQQVAQKMKQIEDRVISHEQAHMAAGGDLAGGASYTYVRGPDGRMYISGGEVGISMPVSDNPEETIANMDRVQRAALAPADPSPQDLRVASSAAMVAQQARAQLQKQQMQENNPYLMQSGQPQMKIDQRF